MKVVIYARPGMVDRFRPVAEECGAEIVAHSADGAEILKIIKTAPADLLVLDPQLDFSTASQAARDSHQLHRSAVAFLSPSDDIVREVLLTLNPVGFLPPDFAQGDVMSLLAAARAETDHGRQRRPRSASRSAAILPWELVALAAMMVAIVVGFLLPDGLAVLERAGEKSYYLVFGLAMISAGCLFGVRRPRMASFNFAVIALVAMLPTQ